MITLDEQRCVCGVWDENCEHCNHRDEKIAQLQDQLIDALVESTRADMITLNEQKETGPKTRNPQGSEMRDTTKQGLPVDHDEDQVVKWTQNSVLAEARAVGLKATCYVYPTPEFKRGYEYIFETPNGFRHWTSNSTTEAVNFIKGFQMLQFLRNFPSA